MEWQLIDTDHVVFATEHAAREAILCVTHERLSLQDVAAVARRTLDRQSRFADAIDPADRLLSLGFSEQLSALLTETVAHARADHPDEACGVVAGPVGGDLPERFIPMVNAARSPTFYEFDSMDLLRLYREMDDREEEPVVIYHSHTVTEAYPSRTDISYASEPNAHYVLVSTRETGNLDGPYEFRSYRIRDGVVAEEEVQVLPR